jgi:hypothetical protein
MSYAIIEAKVYQWEDSKGNTLPDYVIMNLYDGKFLEWNEVMPIGVKEADEQCGCDGSVILHSYQHAEKVVEALGGVVASVR